MVREPAKTKPQQAELLRQQVDSVGQVGKPGAQIQNVISVGMLSEGWDAKTVTHIMGLRAFTSQLLCEQVVGRGLRRTSYEVDPETGLFEPEFVNVFGVPFAFLPAPGGGRGRPAADTTQNVRGAAGGAEPSLRSAGRTWFELITCIVRGCRWILRRRRAAAPECQRDREPGGTGAAGGW